jgi:hypothetical protein
LSKAPLSNTTTLLPGRSGLSSIPRIQRNVHIGLPVERERLSQVCCCSGTIWGPAGHQNDLRLIAVEETACHSGVTGTSNWMVPAPRAVAGNAAAVRDTATTEAPAFAKAMAIPRPRPRLAPTTIAVLPFKCTAISTSLASGKRRPDLERGEQSS